MAASTQMICPHCGSTLTFGTEIATGTPVDCLICMQGFTATPLAAAPKPMVGADTVTMSATVATPPAKKPPIPRAKPAMVPVGKPANSGITQKPIPLAAKANPDADLPTPPVLRRPARSSTGGKFALLAMALGLGFLLTGGIVFAIVKITASTRVGHPEKPGPQLADNGKKPVVESPDAKDKPSSPDEQGSSNAQLSDAEEEQIRNKLREETKQLLKRKIKIGGDEPEWQPIATIDGGNQEDLGLSQWKINEAIDKGVAFLRSSQQANGTWHNAYGVGHAAIGGLTLLECKVPAHDPAVKRAAQFVRSNVGNLTFTYELSLAILFLDRLGDASDRVLIQGMSMRLLAGQNDCGGWTYNCPTMTPHEMLQLLNFLQSNKKPNLLDPLQGKTPAGVRADPLRDPIAMEDRSDVLAQNPAPNPKKPAKNPPKMAPIRPEMLQGNLQNLFIVRNHGAHKGKATLRHGAGDNSNTQFALLALWTARRHDVPTDPALLAAFQRFSSSQHPTDGGWGYAPGNGTTNTMTCVGLLGMAMGHGASPEIVRFNPKDPKDLVVKPALEDPKIQIGLQALARNIGEPRFEKNAEFPMQNLYFLWSVERVAMLYDLKTIGGKDWYGWGAQILVHNQQATGAWPTAFYHGNNPPLNTCFALLFLKRSNLVQDLTNNLRLYTGIRETEK